MLHERFVADVLPTYHSFSIDQKRSMQRFILEIIKATILLEHFKIAIGRQADWHFSVEGFDRLLQSFMVIRTNSDHFDSLLLKIVHAWSERVQLFSTMQTAMSKVKNHHYRFAQILFGTSWRIKCILENPLRCC